MLESPYFGYIFAAYALALAALGGYALHSYLSYLRVKRKLGAQGGHEA